MRGVLVFMTFWLLAAGVWAQDDTPAYRLRVPSAEEYLTAVPEIVSQMRIDDTSEYQRDYYELRRMVNQEFWRRYDDLSLVPLEVLNDAELHIDRSIDYDVSTPKSEPGWHNLFLSRWLQESQPDLSTRIVWRFSDYTLHVEPVDFTGDGINELAAQFVYQPGQFVDFTEYLVLKRDRTQPEGYRRLGETNFWFSTRCAYQLSCGGEGELQQILDLTGDGLPEWIISRGSCGWGLCGVTLYVFGWWQEQFVDLTQLDRISMQVVSGGGGPPTYPPQGDWIFESIDDDRALEILQMESITDNRGCEFSSEQIFNWNETAGQFQGREIVYEYADTPWCALRQAHDAMIEGNPEAAIPYYEHMLTFDPPSDLADLWHYARVRLAAAYALSGRAEEARASLDEINPETIEDETIRAVVETAQSVFTTNPDGKQLCASLAEAVAEGGFTPILLTYGQSNDYWVPLTYGGGDFSPANAGCDIYSLWRRTVDKLSEEQGSLKEQIEAAGWNVAAEYEFDINEDGINEVVVWTELGGLAAFQSSDKGKIHYSTAPVSQPTEYSQLTMISLPDHGNLLVRIAFNPEIECQMDRNYQPGSVDVWRLEQDRLIHTGGQTICAPQTIAETFPRPGEMHLKSTLNGDNLIRYWDSEQLLFTLPSDNSLTAESSVEDLLSCTWNMYGFCGSLDNPAESLELIKVVLSSSQRHTSTQFVTAFNYYRALALEALDRPDEALAEFIAIYEAAPESAWGMLAALHLEPVEP